MSQWRESTLDDVLLSCDYGLSCPLSTDPSGVPILRMGNLRGGRVSLEDLKYAPCERVGEKDLLSPGDVLLNRTNSSDLVGKVGLFSAPTRVTFASYLFRLRVDPAKALAEWLLQALHSPTRQAELRDIATPGVSQANINRGRLRELALLVPPLAEQRKIAAILSSVDDAIEATQAVIDQLQVVKKAMMAELLTRGLPGRHTKFKMTEIGEVPEEWTVGAIAKLARLGSGGTPSRDRPEYWNGGIPWVKTGEINYEPITDTEETISQLGVQNSAAKMYPAGTVLMAMYGQGVTRGRVARLAIDATVNQACLAITPNSEVIADYLLQFLTARYDHLRELGHEGTQKNLNAKLVGELIMPVPSTVEQRAIVDLLQSVDARKRLESDSARALGTVKSALMAVLLTGEVRVTPDEEPG